MDKGNHYIKFALLWGRLLKRLSRIFRGAGQKYNNKVVKIRQDLLYFELVGRSLMVKAVNKAL